MKKSVLLTSIIFILLLIFVFGCSADSADEEVAEPTVWEPDKPITVVIQWGAGGGTDTVIRTILPYLEEELGVPVNPVNMTGATGSVAGRHLLDSPADGYTVMGAGDFNVPFRNMGLLDAAPWRDFKYFMLATSIESFSVHADSPYETLEDVVEAAKSGKNVLVSNDGIGGLWHTGATFVEKAGNVDFTEVPYDGGYPATMAAVQKEVDMVCGGLHEQYAFLQEGTLRNLATFSTEPIEVPGYGTTKPIIDIYPEVTGDFAPYGGIYLLALRRDTPIHIIETYKNALEKAMNNPEVIDKLRENYIFVNLMLGDEVDERGARMEILLSSIMDDLDISEVTREEMGLPPLEDFDEWWPPEEYQPIWPE